MQVQNIGRHFPVGVGGRARNLLFGKMGPAMEIRSLAFECLERRLRPIEACNPGGSNIGVLGGAILTSEGILEHLGFSTGETGVRALAFFGGRTLRLGQLIGVLIVVVPVLTKATYESPIVEYTTASITACCFSATNSLACHATHTSLVVKAMMDHL